MIPFEITDWENVPATEHKGETGTSFWRTGTYHGLRVRLVDYSPNYKADHWCSKGHVIFCVEGSFTNHLKDGTHNLSETGARLFIVDGDFLQAY